MTGPAAPGTLLRRLPEHKVPGKPLGRHVHHDPRSRAYPVRAAAATAISRRWERRSPILDQGPVGSCTGNAADGVLGTVPFYPIVQQAMPSWNFDEDDALRIYQLATTLDPFPGEYPATDTGSDGLSVAKACVQLNLISGYRHCLSLDAVVTALQTGPVITGVNWYDTFDQPNSDGLVTLTTNSTVRGGHEVEIFGLDMDAHRLWMCQSWGANWGQAGTFCWSFPDYDRLLHEEGDATVFVPLTQPAPTPVVFQPDAADRDLVEHATICTRISRPYRKWKQAKALG